MMGAARLLETRTEIGSVSGIGIETGTEMQTGCDRRSSSESMRSGYASGREQNGAPSFGGERGGIHN
jgi:hypothetical protein